jgi:hypothetical protein
MLEKTRRLTTWGGVKPRSSHEKASCNTGCETRIVVAFNTVDQPRLWEWSGKGTMLISSYLDRAEMPLNTSILLRKSEGVIIRRD